MIKKKQNFNIFIIAVIIFTMIFSSISAVVADNLLSDIKGHWAQDTIEDLVDRRIIEGYPDGTFRPNNNITRAEFTSLLVRAFDLKSGLGKVFSDTANHWAGDYIKTANYHGLVNGYSDTLFGPDEPVTREQIAAMVVNATKVESVDESKTFTDSAQISAWAKEPVAKAATAGLITGYPDGSFKPKANATRAEAAAILDRSMKITIDEETITTFDIAGTYGPEDGIKTIETDVTINADGVVLQNTVIKGNLIISEKVGDGDVTLDNVTVKGTTFVYGGGKDSIHINGGQYNNIIIEGTPDGNVRIVAIDAKGIKIIVTENAAGEEIILEGTFESVEIDSNDIVLSTQGKTNINKIKVHKNLSDIRLNVDKDTTINELILDSAARVKNARDTIKRIDGDKVSGSYVENSPEKEREPSTGGGYEPSERTAVDSVNIEGKPVVGQTLTATVKPSRAAVNYQWQRASALNGTYTNIIGATAKIYTLTTADAGHYIKVVAKGRGDYRGTVSSKPIGPIIDKNNLQATIATALGLDEADYTAESWADFAAALTTAQDVLADEKATQGEVDDALSDLNEAIEGLEEIEEPPVVDKSELEAAVETALGLDEADYTAESWADLAAALTTAQDVLADEKATQGEVDDALSALEDAIEGLKEAEEPPVELIGIEITTAPTKTEYEIGEELDLAGLVVTAKYDDDSTEVIEVTTDMVTGFDSSTAAEEQIITVTYEGYTATFSITIIEIEPDTYTLTVEADPTEGGTVTGGGDYEEGTEVKLTATAAEGYEFINWTTGEEEVSTDADFTYTMPSEDVTLTANFKEIEVPVTPVTLEIYPEKAGIGDEITLNGNAEPNILVSIKVVDEAGKIVYFDGVKSGSDGKYNTTFIVPDEITGNLTIVAGYDTNVATKVLEITESEPVDKIALQAKVDEAAELDEEDYTEESWATFAAALADAQSVLDDETATQGEVDDALSALEDAIEGLKEAEEPPVELIGIEITTAPTKTEYEIGEELNLAGLVVTAKYDDDSTEVIEVTTDMVTGFDSSTAAEEQIITVTYEGYTATFSITIIEIEPDTYTLTVEADPTEGGTVTGGGDYEEGTEVKLTATAAEGYEFINWTIGEEEVSTDATFTYTMPAEAVTLTANFKEAVIPPAELVGIEITTAPTKIEYEIGEELDLAGLVVTAKYDDDSTKVIEVTTDMVTGFDSGAAAEEQIITVTYKGYTATFSITIIEVEPDTYTLTVEAEPTEGGTVTGGGDYEEGTEVKLTATAAEGYEFINWTIGEEEVSTDATFTYTMPAEAVILTANFKEIEVPVTPVTLEIYPEKARIGDEITLSGNAEPNILVSIKVVDEAGKIVYFDGVKSGSDGKYNTTFIVPDEITGNLTIVAGYDTNVATKVLEITESEPVDKTALQAKVDEAAELDEEDYTEESWATFAAALADAQSVLDDEKATQGEVDDALSALEDAIESLEEAEEPPAELIGIEITTAPTKTEYEIGEELDLAGLVVTAKYDDDSTEVIEVTTDMVTGFDSSTAADEQIITVTYEGHTATFIITIIEIEPDTYTLTVEAEPTEGGTVTGGGDYEEGVEVEVTAEANAGYEFINWTTGEEEVSTDADFTYTMPAEDVTLVANFKEVVIPPVELVGIEITTAPTKTEYEIGEELDLAGLVVTAKYDDDSTEVIEVTTDMVTGFDSSTAAEEQIITVTYEGHTATFSITIIEIEPDTYTLTVEAEPTEGGTVTGGGDYEEGVEVEVTAEANAGYEFINWTTGEEEVSTDADFTYTMPSEDVTLTANFKEIEVPVTPVTLEIYPEKAGIGDEITLNGNAEPNILVSIKVVDEAGKIVYFDGVKSGSDGKYNTTFIVPDEITGNLIIVAGYDTNVATKVLEITESEPVDKTALQAKVDEAAELDEEDYTEESWATFAAALADAQSVLDDEKATQGEVDDALSALEDAIESLEEAEEPPAELIGIEITTAPTKTEYEIGEELDLAGLVVTAKYDDDSTEVIEVTTDMVTGFDSSTAADEQIITVTYEGHTATFIITIIEIEPDTYTLTVEAEPTEGGTVTGGGDYEEGTEVKLTATAAEGYEFINWTTGEEEVSTKADFTYTMPAEAVTLTANFKEVVIPPAELIGIEITTAPTKTEYEIGEELDLAGLVVTAKYDDDSTEVIEVTTDMVTGFDSSTAADEQIITVTYEGHTATFIITIIEIEPDTYTLTVEAEPTEGGTVTGGGDYEEGTEVKLTATAAEGYEFINWTTGEEEVSTEADFTYTMPAEAVTLTANFKEIEVPVTPVTLEIYPEKARIGDEITLNGNAEPNILVSIKVVDEAGKIVYFDGVKSGGDGKYNTTFIVPDEITGNLIIVAGYDTNVATKVLEITESEPVDKTALQAKVDEAAELDEEDYTEESWATFAAALADAQSVLDDEKATQGEVDDALSALEDAIESLEEAEEPPAELIGIEITTAPTKTEYEIGEELDLAGLVVTAKYDDDSTEVIEVTTDMVTGFDSSTAADEQIITVTYEGHTATFIITIIEIEPDTYTLTVEAEPTEGGTVTGGGDYEEGTEVKLTATAAEGYEFINWTTGEEEVSTKADFTYTMPAEAVTLTANFKEVVIPPAELIGIEITTAPTKTEYEIGEELDLAGLVVTAKYDDDSTEVIEVTTDMVTGFDSSTAAEEQIITVTYEGYTATFSITIIEIEPDTYTLTVEAEPTEGGTVTGGGDYEEGTEVKLTATAAEGYEFINWTTGEEEVSTKADFTYTMPAEAVTLTANFKEVVIPPAELIGIEITTAPTKIEYEIGEELNLAGLVVTAKYDDDSTEVIEVTTDMVTGFDSSTAADEQIITVTYEGHTATFSITIIEIEPDTYTLTVEADPTEGGTVTGGGDYEEGTEVKLTATAAEGYEFINWTTGEEEVSTDADFTYTMPSENVTLTANFKEIEVPVTPVTLEIYPEKARIGDEITLNGNAEPNILVSIKVVDEAGKIVYFDGVKSGSDGKYNTTFIVPDEITGNLTIVAGYDTNVATKVLEITESEPVDKTALQAKVDEAAELDEEDYTEESWATFAAALADAQSVLDDEKATQGEVDDALSALEDAIESLEEAEEPPAELIGIEITTAPTKTEYEIGEELDLAGLVVTAKYDDDSTEVIEVTTDMVTGFDSSTAADEQIITVTYEGHTATFIITIIEIEPDTYTLTVEAEPTEGGTVTGGGDYEEGTEVKLTATAAEGYEFINWTTGEEEVSTKADFTYTMPAEDVTLVANFKEVVIPPVELVGIEITTAPTKTEYEIGEELDLAGLVVTAKYDDDSTEVIEVTTDMVTGFDSSTAAEEQIITVTYEGHTATFSITIIEIEPDTYTLTVEAEPTEGGTVTGGGDYEEGTEVKLTATAAEGYEFINWTTGEEEVSTEADFTYTMPAEAVTLTANFKEIEVPVTPVTLEIYPEKARIGDEITLNGNAEPNILVSIKVVDEAGKIVYFDGVKSGSDGKYNTTFIVPDEITGNLIIVAGYGENVAAKALEITEDEPVDKGELEAAIETALELNEKDYTADSWADFAAVLTDAQAILADEGATQEQVDDILVALITAITGLEVKEPIVTVTLEIDPTKAKMDDEIALSGNADPNILISIKVVDEAGKIVYFDCVKSGSDGEYSTTFMVPDDITGNLTIVAGYGTNVATKVLEIIAGR